MQGDLCDNMGFVLAYLPSGAMSVSPSHHDPAIPILSPLHVGHPYNIIPIFKIIDLLIAVSVSYTSSMSL